MEFTSADNTLGEVGQQIEQKLREAFQPSYLQVIDESYKHAGHSAMQTHNRSGETHFKVIVVSDAFDKKLPIDRHRAVNECLRSELEQGVHALSIEAKTIKQWEAKNKNI